MTVSGRMLKPPLILLALLVLVPRMTEQAIAGPYVRLLLPDVPEWAANVLEDSVVAFVGGKIKQIDRTTIVNFMSQEWSKIEQIFKSKQPSLTEKELKELSSVVKRFNQVVTGTEYDIIVNSTSLKAIAEGWQIYMSPNSKLNGKFKGRVVGFMGNFDTGKTWVLNMLTGKTYPEGITKTTVGLSGALHDSILFLDSEGSKRASRYHYEDRLGSDQFIQDMVIQLSDVIIYVVDSLQTTDIPVINKVYRDLLKRSTGMFSKQLIIVHNFPRFHEIDEVERHIKDDILTAFNSTETTNFGNTCKLHVSHTDVVSHIVFAHAGSEAGKLHNECGKTVLDNAIRGMLGLREVDILSEIRASSESLLPKYFFVPGTDPTAVPEVFAPALESIGRDGALNTVIENFNKFHRVVGKVAQKMIKKITDVKKSVLYYLGFSVDDQTKDKQPSNPFEVQLSDSAECSLKIKEANVMCTSNPPLMKLKTPAALYYLPFYGGFGPDAAFEPQYDLYLQDTRWLLIVDMPGTTWETTCIEEITLQVHGIRLADHSLGKRLDTMRVRRYGYFSLRFTLPWGNCQSAKKLATYKDGEFKIDYTRTITTNEFDEEIEPVDYSNTECTNGECKFV